MPKTAITDTLPLPNHPSSSTTIPQLGFGTYLSHPDQALASCLSALKSGYRHIDTAQYYANEEEVGQAVKKSGLARNSVYLTTKILAPEDSVHENYENCVESVRKLDGKDGYVDLFLIHSPSPGKSKELWMALERLYAEGKARSIGGIRDIEELRGLGKVWPPHVNQIELHPWHQQKDIVQYCEKNGIVVEAYCPIVRNQKADDKTVAGIAKKHGVTPNQVLIRWSLQKGWVCLPKSDNPERIRMNADVHGFELGDDDMKALNGLDQGAAGGIVQTVKN